MATREPKACVTCMNDFDATSRQTVALPCGHNFCLTCLVRLKASDSPVCPLCRQSFAKVELRGFSKMAEASDKSKLARCKKHEEPLVYWSTRSNELYCTTCILSANVNRSCLKRISDAFPLIQDDLESKALTVKNGLARDLKNHREERKRAVQELARIDTFEKSILKLKADYQQFIEKVDTHNSKLREQSTSVDKIEEKISEILSEEDIEIVLSCAETLQELHKIYAGNQQERASRHSSYEHFIEISSLMPEVDSSMNHHQVQHLMRPAKLLSDIACVFEEGEVHEAAFIQKLQWQMKRRNSRSGSACISDRVVSVMIEEVE